MDQVVPFERVFSCYSGYSKSPSHDNTNQSSGICSLRWKEKGNANKLQVVRPPSILVTVEYWFHCVLCWERWACDHTRNARPDCTNRRDFSSVNQMALVWLSCFTNTAAKRWCQNVLHHGMCYLLRTTLARPSGKLKRFELHLVIRNRSWSLPLFFLFLDIWVPFFSLFLCNVNCWRHGNPDACQYCMID